MDGAGHQVQHRREVVNSGADVCQGGLKAGDQGGLAVGADPLQDHLDHRFLPGLAVGEPHALAVTRDLDDGVEHRADRKALVGDLAHDAVDEERGVVLQDLKPFQARRALDRLQADDGEGAFALRAEGPEVGQQGGERLGRNFGQFVGRRVVGGLDDEGVGGGGFVAGDLGEG